MNCRNGFFAAMICCFVMVFAVPLHAKSADVFTTNPASHVISDDHSGLALFGYDPVAYHTDSKAVEGKSAFIVTYQNLVWRFTSSANQEAFQADPSAYIPAFGGHDALSVSQGRMSAGDPNNFLVLRGTLIFFRSQDNRDQFSVEPEAYKTALSRWPVVVRQHASH